ncbi:hypothetical protein GN958_ATG11583 [Phytophthora infestans]|uniref:Uncharacterized protein n=1 Tax=Phytophthora infestans TaxID=4787 RepID=A0A8S9UFB9_PHYIN|nr:hypothetical protein GN958_ATG11583 [Phytophthora infestans]
MSHRTLSALATRAGDIDRRKTSSRTFQAVVSPIVLSNCLAFDDTKSAQNVEINGNHQVERVQGVKPVQMHHDSASSQWKSSLIRRAIQSGAKVYELDLEPHLRTTALTKPHLSADAVVAICKPRSRISCTTPFSEFDQLFEQELRSLNDAR